MDTFLIILLFAFTVAGFGFILYRMNRTIKELKENSPTGQVTQDEAFAAFVDLLIEEVPEFVADYEAIISDENTDEDKMKVVVGMIVDDILSFIETERHGDKKLESIYKLIQMVPRNLIVDTISKSVMEFINKFLADRKAREDSIVDTLAEEHGITE